MNRITGFPPLLGTSPRVLVLGSMPSVASLDKQQYYGKPQNAFWRIMGELFAAGSELDYAVRAGNLTDAGIAVWDVLASCVRPGSLDSAIDMQTAEVNPLVELLGQEKTIAHVFFNGRKAEEIFQRLIMPELQRTDILFDCLPSTSPANAAMNFETKLERWRAVAVAVSQGSPA